ncbi:hypothetical protein BCR34DRAFT_570736, partial [Clohesyomyces aquaticus]
MPIVPYLVNNGGGQAPLRGFLPSLSSTPIPSALIPTYPPVAVFSTQPPDHIPIVAPDAAPEDSRPTIDIPTNHPSHAQSTGQDPALSLAPVEGCHGSPNTQMKGRKPAIAAAGTFLSLFTFSQIYQNAIFPKITPISERLEEKHWVASSHSWLDRKACNWFGLCGLAHLNKSGWTKEKSKGSRRKQQKPISGDKEHIDPDAYWTSATTSPEDWSDEERVLREIPEYVLEYAPYIHLYSGEEFWPCDIADHLIHTTPHLNYTPLQASSDHPNLTNLEELNKWGRFVYLQSDDNVESRPQWLGGETNIPNNPEDSDPWAALEQPMSKNLDRDPDAGKEDWYEVGLGDTADKGGIRPAPGATTPTVTPEGVELLHQPEESWQPELTRRKLGKEVIGGRSDAPAVLIVVDKGDGIVDAFWFFFYSYNLGNKVFNVRFGNHVGDWEHTVVRFQHGEPKAVFFSEHSFGEAYAYDAVEKIGKRVSLIYSS